MKTLTKNSGLLAAIIIALFITSCTKQNADVSAGGSVDDSLVISSPASPSGPTSTTDTYSHVQFINANPVIGPLSLYIAGNQCGVGLSIYGSGEMGYFNATPSVPRESLQIKSAAGNIIKSTSSGFYAGQYFTLFYVGETSNQGILLASDNRPTTPPAAGTAQIKFVNAAPSSSYTDVALNGTSIIGVQQYGVNTIYKTVNAGTYTINFTTHSSGATIATIPSAVLQSGKVYAVYIRDDIRNNQIAFDAGMYTVE